MDVGFTIYNEGNIVTPMFSVSFWLSNSGGPNFLHEYELYLSSRTLGLWWIVQRRNLMPKL